MKIVVLGLWHLGCVTAASCSRYFDVTGLDFDEELVASLRDGKLPISEPGLTEVFKKGLEIGRLKVTADSRTACRDADIVWVTYDTPLDEEDRPDSGFVLERVREVVPHLRCGAVILLSSQLKVGACRQVEESCPGFGVACSPENLRLGRSLEDFNQPNRVVVGYRREEDRALLAELFRPFSENIIWMRPESAEMTKHALNSFLAVSISFANEIARLCELTGADAREVESGLKTDCRIGARAYLSPGGPFAGGTLARDVQALSEIGDQCGENLELIPAIKRSNDRHKGWAQRRLKDQLGELRGRVVCVLGLTYKPHTDTLRRSAAVDLCKSLSAEGCQVRSFDPALKRLPCGLSSIGWSENAEDAVRGADAVVICTEWPEFKLLHWGNLLDEMRQPLVCDANGFLKTVLGGHSKVRYFCVGTQS